MPEPLYQFAEGLRALLTLRSAREVARAWSDLRPDDVGWEALHRAWRLDGASWDRILDECDGLLLRLLDRLPFLGPPDDVAAVHLRTFRIPALERLQHATAAALVTQRYGVAGLRTVVADEDAPLARRYFAFFALALRHPRSEWPLFERYLTPDAHHAFLGAAVEASRFYSGCGAAPRLVELFDGVRGDLHLRTFLSPRILGSLYVLEEPATLRFFRELLVAGFTDADPARCEVTAALVMVRRFTGRLEECTKYPDPGAAWVAQAVDRAEAAFESRRTVLCPVAVI
ncbi:MAG TPA: hypothetical protein VD793_10425 [Gemmatimonadales bacterium]|nr:hypothetical protein [Gemmatimonadales bacterium]